MSSVSLSEPASKPSNSATVEQVSNWLFSQTADAGSISPNGDDTWTLTLTDVDPVVLGFTDRPLRDAQAGTVERLVEAWPAMFGDSNPNGVVVAHYATGDTHSTVVKWIDPSLDGFTMTYMVCGLTNGGRLGLDSLQRPAQPNLQIADPERQRRHLAPKQRGGRLDLPPLCRLSDV